MSDLPYRGDGTDRPALPLPPAPMPGWRRGRPLKRWRYVGVYGPQFQLCVGIAHVAGLPQAFWAVWDRERGKLHERTTKFRTGHLDVTGEHVRVDDGKVSLDLALVSDGDPVEVVSQHGSAYIWTRKVPLTATGTLTINGVITDISARGLLDESAGYHARTTRWNWSAGVGTSADGHRLTWNLVTGLHDSATGSERTVWVDGVASETVPVTFAPDLGSVAFADGDRLTFAGEATRTAHENLLIVASDYEQPFGRFTGTLPDGIELTSGYGVMERHSARW